MFLFSQQGGPDKGKRGAVFLFSLGGLPFCLYVDVGVVCLSVVLFAIHRLGLFVFRDMG